MSSEPSTTNGLTPTPAPTPAPDLTTAEALLNATERDLGTIPLGKAIPGNLVATADFALRRAQAHAAADIAQSLRRLADAMPSLIDAFGQLNAKMSELTALERRMDEERTTDRTTDRTTVSDWDGNVVATTPAGAYARCRCGHPRSMHADQGTGACLRFAGLKHVACYCSAFTQGAGR